MSVDVNDFTQHPICDTDIWVNLCLGDVLDEFFSVHTRIIVADVVEEEIMKWQTNTDYSKIATEYQKYKQSGCILVIQHDVHIETTVRKLLEKTLLDLGFANDFANKPPEDNKGEYVSAIYADHFGIPFLKSNDNAFQEGGRGRKEFPDLKVKNWNDTIRELIADDKKRFAIVSKVEKENMRMGKLKKQHEGRKALKEKISMEEKLEQLKQRFSKRF